MKNGLFKTGGAKRWGIEENERKYTEKLLYT